jgi:PAS domain S-box-containing protein
MKLNLDFQHYWKRLPWAVQVAIAALVYAAIAHLSLVLAIPGTSASPVWPPSGFAVALLFLGGKRLWPAIAVGALVANLIDFSAHGPLMPSQYFAASAIAIGNTLEAWVAAWFLLRFNGTEPLFGRTSGVLRFAVIAPIASAISASVGVETLVLTGILPAAIGGKVWLTWWLGDLTGMVVLLPCVVVWVQAAKLANRLARPWIAGLVLTAMAWIIFTNPFASVTHARPFLILLVPLFAWLTYQHGLRGGVVGILVLAGSAVLAVTKGHSLLGTANTNDLFMQLDAVLILFAVLVLLLGTDLAERHRPGETLDWQALAIAWGTLTMGCALTLFLWHLNASRIEDDANRRLLRSSERVVAALQLRIQNYQQIIKGGANLFLGRTSVSRTVWQDYVQSLDLANTLPGVQGVGFSEVITANTLARYTARVRSEGFPNYTVRPPGVRDTYVCIAYLEPYDVRNQRAFGYDMFSEPIRREALILARDTGKITASGKVKLVQENGLAEQAGFIIYMPIYSQQRGLETPAQRQAALIGYANAPFRVGDLIKLALPTELEGLAITLYDTVEALPKNRMYPLNLGPDDANAPVGAATYTSTIDVGNRLWTAELRPLPSYWQSVDHTASRLTLIFGMLLSVAMFLLLRTLARSRVQGQEAMHFRSVIEQAPSALIMVNQDGRIEMVNAPIERMFGYPRGELLGQSVDMLLAQRLRGADILLRQEFTKYPKTRPTGQERDIYGLCKDGTEIALEIGLSRLSNAAGNKILCGFVDVTERKRNEATVLKSSRELERTAALAKVGGWELDLRTSTIAWTNETCRIHEVALGYQPTLDDAMAFYPPEARPVIQKAVDNAIASGDGWDLALPLITAQSRRIWVRSQGEVEYENGVAVRLVGALKDITERKIHADEMARRNEELDKFAYIASHDLKSPLRGIDQLATWISEDLGDSIADSAKEHLRLMRVRIHRMENLLNGLLSYARAGRVEAHPEQVDTKVLVNDIYDLCHNHAPFQLRLVGDFPKVLTLRVPLELVIRNLITNAIKHHDQATGVITITAKADGQKMVFEVADDGPGIPEDQIERAFGMFQTLRPRDEVEGSGIGLAIVRKTIEALGGTIALTPNTPRGARFQFTWPLVSAKP